MTLDVRYRVWGPWLHNGEAFSGEGVGAKTLSEKALKA